VRPGKRIIRGSLVRYVCRSETEKTSDALAAFGYGTLLRTGQQAIGTVGDFCSCLCCGQRHPFVEGDWLPECPCHRGPTQWVFMPRED
jgi:hypothetical protein